MKSSRDDFSGAINKVTFTLRNDQQTLRIPQQDQIICTQNHLN